MNMDELISRQAAIDALHTWFRDGFDEDKWWNSTHVLEALKGVPSAQPERKKGKDIYMKAKGHCEFKCSVCGVEIPNIEDGELDGGNFRFCPKCGAEME